MGRTRGRRARRRTLTPTNTRMRAMWDAKRATAAAIVGAAALLGSLIGAASAEAATARAYVLIEAADFAGAQHVAEALGRLHRCKGVSATLGPNEVVARV